MPNQYLQQSANDIATNLTQNWQNNVLPSINSGAIAAGGFGGSRQGVAQANSINGLNQSIGQAQTNLYSQGYNTDQQLQAQRDMQAAQLASNQSIASMQDATNRYGLGNQFNLGLGGLGLQNKSLDQNFYTAQRGQDLNQYGLGASLANTGNLGLGNQGQQLYQNGYQQQQAPWQSLGQYAGTLQPFTGLNGSSTSTTPGYSPLQGGLAGGLTAAQLWKLLSGG